MDNNTVNNKWLKHVINGEKSKGRYAGAAYWFRDNVMFNHSLPIGRLECDEKNGWMLLRLYHTQCFIYPAAGGKLAAQLNTKVNERAVTLSTIGVHTDRAGHMVPSGEPLFAFMRDYFDRDIAEIREMMRELPSNTPEWNVSRVKNRIVDIKTGYTRFNKHFRLGWPDLPDLDLELGTRVDTLMKRYRDPKAVAQRERNAAKRAAMKALGIEK